MLFWQESRICLGCLILLLASAGSLQAAEGAVQLSPANTKVQFVGSHVVPQKPDPNERHGEFKKLNGTAVLTDGKLNSLELTIETSSLASGIDKLDAHLKSPDFFNVRQYPRATFRSTKIETTEPGKAKVTGNFTLLKETKPISFDVSYSTSDSLKLTAKFTVDRSKFGMNYGIDKVEKDVELTVAIGG